MVFTWRRLRCINIKSDHLSRHWQSLPVTTTFRSAKLSRKFGRYRSSIVIDANTKSMTTRIHNESTQLFRQFIFQLLFYFSKKRLWQLAHIFLCRMKKWNKPVLVYSLCNDSTFISKPMMTDKEGEESRATSRSIRPVNGSLVYMEHTARSWELGAGRLMPCWPCRRVLSSFKFSCRNDRQLHHRRFVIRPRQNDGAPLTRPARHAPVKLDFLQLTSKSRSHFIGRIVGRSGQCYSDQPAIPDGSHLLPRHRRVFILKRKIYFPLFFSKFFLGFLVELSCYFTFEMKKTNKNRQNKKH